MKIKFGIKQKVYLGFGALLFLFLLSAISSFVTLQKLQKTALELSDEVEPVARLNREGKEFLRSSKDDLTQMINFGTISPETYKAIYLDSVLAQLDTNINQLASQDISEKHLAHVAKLQALMSNINDNYVPVINETIDLYLVGDSASLATARLDKLGMVNRNVKGILEILDEDINSIESEISVLDKSLNKNNNLLMLLIGIFAVLLFLLGLIIMFVVGNMLTSPINIIKNVVASLGKGEIPDLQFKARKDEVGEIHTNLHLLVDGLKAKSRFADNIGSGMLNADFEPISEVDTLGHSLLEMRDSLKDAEEKDQQRNEEVQVVAEVGTILRAHNDLESMGDALIHYLTQKVKAVQGAFYVVEKDEETKESIIHLRNSYAYNRKKYLQKEFKVGQGLVGQAVIERDIVHRSEIPETYTSITSGLIQDKKPSSILILPLISNEEVYGVLEFASLQAFSDRDIIILRKVSEIVAQTIFNVQVNERTRNLLDQSQKMSSELQEQSVILQQNAEEMKATQEELKRSNIALEEQIEAVNQSQKRIHVLLENSAEIITICDEKGNLSYISPSVSAILGYSEEELAGTNDQNRIHEDSITSYQQMLDDLLTKPDETITIELSYLHKNGEYIWMEITGKNLIAEPAVGGIVLNSRDITVRKLAEQESRMRSQMQSLSENSPDLICRLNDEGKVFYINPTIEGLVGQKPDEFLQRDYRETAFPEAVKEPWETILSAVKDTQTKVNEEVVFPTHTGDEKIMSINAIPEFNLDNILESVLFVANDITERKKQELEIAHTNKKINDSINYAERIQSAILPDNSEIRKYLPESFTFYRPRDVVSGDFPWFLKVGDNIFIAAVDCTGHGVPGALLSLIGYFLLNDIVRSRKIMEVGKVLDLLDEGVTSTLRQDQEGVDAKDGMDIALVRINQKTGEVTFSGAHRPLYCLINGEMVEYKGNKFAIGGGKYANQTEFTTHEVAYSQGDEIYFCSDGYPDQFGGPRDRKIGPKRIRELIVDNKEVVSMDEKHDIFANFFIDWKADGRQMDDVLMIGIKL